MFKLRTVFVTCAIIAGQVAYIGEVWAGQVVIEGLGAEKIIANGHVQEFKSTHSAGGHYFMYLVHHDDGVYFCRWSYETTNHTVKTWCITYAND